MNAAPRPVPPPPAARAWLRALDAPRGRRSLPRRRAATAPHVPEWSDFVRRCVSTWIAAEGSVWAFLEHWSPVELFKPAPAPLHRPLRRRATAGRPLAARRAPHCPPSTPRPATSSMAVFDMVDPAALRRQFPYVAELLVELVALPPRDARRVAARKRTRASR